MKTYLAAVRAQLMVETYKSLPASRGWLLRMLEADDWWLRASRAHEICANLVIKNPAEKFYYRDVFIWLPDVRWPREGMPACPNCKCNSKVQLHAHADVRDFGRRVTAEHTHYYVASRRYKCTKCEAQAAASKAAALAMKAARGRAAAGRVSVEMVSQTFTGYNSVSLDLLPHGWGELFPAFLTKRAGLDKGLVYLMELLLPAGIRANKLAKIIRALHTVRHADDFIRREEDIKFERTGLAKDFLKDVPFSTFGDTTLYNGSTPSGKYFQDVFVMRAALLRPHMDMEVLPRTALAVGTLCCVPRGRCSAAWFGAQSLLGLTWRCPPR